MMDERALLEPVYHAITAPMLLAGTPREFAILNLTLTLNLVLGLKSPLGIVVGLVVHVLAVFFAKRDPFFLQVFQRHMRRKDYYHV